MADPTVTEEFLDPSPVAALAALFDDGLPVPAAGDVLPPLWHWVALPRWSPSSSLGVDGHPLRDTALGLNDFPRRMFAGGTVRFDGELRVGDTVRRESSIESVTEKHGRSGRLAIMVTSTVLYAPDGTAAVTETQNIVYREAAPQDGPAQGGPAQGAPHPEAAAAELAGPPLTREDDGRWTLRTDPSLLLRFSAATANAHRIHYDWPYATAVEGYPGLVVHGPLMTLALAQTHHLDGGAPIAELTHRTTAPLFCGETATLRAHRSDRGDRLELHGPRGDGPGTVVHLHTR